ncbi:unnamed protein product [Caenorhabditis brenneri]
MVEPHAKTLSDMPAPVLDVVMKEVDLKTVQSVRKVCSNLRNHADSVQLDAKILKAYVYIQSTEKISLELKTAESLFEISYYKDGNDVLVDHDGQKRVENQDIAICAGQDLGSILKNQKSIVRAISLIFPQVYAGQAVTDFLRKMSDALESRKSKLMLKYFSWTGHINEDQILSILEKLDPGTISKIDLTNSSGIQMTCNIDRIVNTDQWKRAKVVETLGFIAQAPMSNFYKFRNAHFRIESVGVDEILTVRQNALKNANFKELHFSYENFIDESQFLDRFGKQHKMFKRKNKCWFYKFPMNDNALVVTWKENRIRFLRVEPKNFEKFLVPEDKLMVL